MTQYEVVALVEREIAEYRYEPGPELVGQPRALIGPFCS
jgi:hypothetical protein